MLFLSIIKQDIILFYFFFFFSSRRRHTRSDRDWSSDVCSSDLPNARSAGSFFMNPVLSAAAFAELQQRWKTAGGTGAIPSYPAGDVVKVPAAWLVEQAGFPKGSRRGGAAVSARHALALVNLGGTTAELLALAEAIRAGVEGRFGIRLQCEPEVVR